MSLRARRHRRIVSSSESDDTGDEINVASPSVLVERLKERDTGKVLVRNGVGTFTGKAQKLQRAMWFDHVASKSRTSLKSHDPPLCLSLTICCIHLYASEKNLATWA